MILIKIKENNGATNFNSNDAYSIHFKHRTITNNKITVKPCLYAKKFQKSIAFKNKSYIYFPSNYSIIMLRLEEPNKILGTLNLFKKRKT